MSRVLYDLAGADPAHRFSPYCWRTRFALAHKGLEVETRAWRFTEKEAIAFSGQGAVPVLRDGETVLHDSWTIACYLEEAYPDAPSLFGGAGGIAPTRFINAWVDTILHPVIVRFIVADIPNVIADKDKAYFLESRLKRFGRPLAEVSADREEKLPAFRQSLAPLRRMLEAGPYLAGAAPAYGDYIVMSVFQWARCVSTFELLAEDDPIFAWRARLLEAFGGLAAQAPRPLTKAA